MFHVRAYSRRWVMLGSAVCALMPAARATELTFDLDIVRGSLPRDKRLIRVRQGDVVKLRWRSDRRIVLHLHGYDIEKTVPPGAVVEMSFLARTTGRFPVSEHKPKTGGGHTHEAPIANVEVHPR